MEETIVKCCETYPRKRLRDRTSSMSVTAMIQVNAHSVLLTWYCLIKTLSVTVISLFFIKGCTKEDYDEFFRVTGYISGTRETGTVTSKLPLCDSDKCCKHNIDTCNPALIYAKTIFPVYHYLFHSLILQLCF